jgi:F-type H+-transporting ATPase subunit beta
MMVAMPTLLIPGPDALLGRIVTTDAAPIDGRGPLVASPAAARPTPPADPRPPILETGIKVIDLFAPITRGGTVSLFAESGLGKLIIISEMIQQRALRHGSCGVIVALEEEQPLASVVFAELANSPAAPHMAMILGQRHNDPLGYAGIALAGLALAEQFCQQGRDVILVVEKNLIQAENSALLRHHSQSGSITSILFDHDETQAGWPISADLLDAQITLSRSLAGQRIYPSIDPLASTSRLISERIVDDQHWQAASQARELLQRADLGSRPAADPAEDALVARARRVQAFQTQPFFVAEQYTRMPGAFVPLPETIRGFAELLAGQHDDLPAAALQYVGSIAQARAAAPDQAQ